MRQTVFPTIYLCCAVTVLLAACDLRQKSDPIADPLPPAQVERESDANLVKVDHPDQFPVITAGKEASAPALNVTGVVSPDVSRTVPVVSLASGRAIAVYARLGDEVKKGQLLLKVRSADISGAFSDYRKAQVAEELARTQLDREKLLYSRGAVAKKDLDVAQSADDSAKVDMETTAERLRVLGSNVNQPSGTVDIFAPISGVITDQQITNGAGVQGLSSPTPFTISDLSHVWIVCDVYENDLSKVHLGEYADIRLNSYPGRVFKGRISNIGAILDPNLRTAKVRLEVANAGSMRIGMFVTATFYGRRKEELAVVPSSAVLHLHDREWVYVSAEGGGFRRLEVVSGDALPGNMEEIQSGLAPGQKVVANALVMQSTAEQ
ncbi:MAG: efflux RND transporter periplasmic adaptor subunit [Bryobacteraceae bacterium]